MTAPSTTAGAARSSARHGRGVLRAAALAVLAGLAAAGCGSSGSSPSPAREAAAPACRPATLDTDSRLPGVPVDVSPAPGSATANPNTQISFLGVPLAQIRDVSVVGTRSGRHRGALRAYSQGDGASFVPDAPFRPDEQVSVRALIGAPGAEKTVAFGFHTDTPYPTAALGEYANPPAPPADYESLATLPGLQPPILTVTTADRDPAAGDVLVTNGPGAGPYGALIYTPQGRLVWFDQLSGGLTAEDLSVQTYDGRRDLTFWTGRVVTLGFGVGQDTVMNSRYQTVAKVAGGNGLKADLHDFQIAPRQIAYITAYNPIHCDLRSSGGARDGVITDSAVQEIDIRTGLVRWEWHTLDHVAPAESETSPPKGFPWDWFHLNSIDPEPNGDLLISARNTWAAYQIHGGSGRILWRLGGLDSSFKMGPGTITRWQHDARMLTNGEVTIFDDESPPAPAASQSRGVTIALDLRARAARLVFAYTHSGQSLRADSQGNMQTLADGNTVVGFGGVPTVSEYAPNGSLLFDAHLPYDLIFYRAFRFPWQAQPSSAPAVVANLDNVSQTIVAASWNGATDVAAWRALAGNRPGSLQPQSTVAVSGFETSTILPERYSYVAVQALDAAGRVLARSRTVRVGTYAASLPGTRRAG